MTKEELTVLARALKIPGYSKSNKRTLIDAILGSEPAKLRRHLHPTWWDKHQRHVYGMSSLIGLIFAVGVWLYAASQPKEAPVEPGPATAGTGIANTGEQVIQGPVTIGGARAEEKP